jgi:hypothetical protein
VRKLWTVEIPCGRWRKKWKKLRLCSTSQTDR